MVKKVAIVTFRFQNFGTVLQAYGLQEALNNVGVEDVEILDFPNEAGPSATEAFVETLKEQVAVYGLAKGLIRSIKEVLFVLRSRLDERKNHTLEKQQRVALFDQFENKYLKLSASMSSSDLRDVEFIKGLPYDCYIAGSDQIWNERYTGCIDIFFLKYMPADTIRMSYAGSFGKTHLDDNKKPIFAELIKNIDPILVREEGAKRIAEEISGREAFHVPDPTLLHDNTFWVKLAEKPDSFSYADYILVYSLNHDVTIYKEALRLGKILNKTVVAIKRSFTPPHNRDIKWLYALGPQHFLWLVNNASMVITNSYHAVVFSLIFNRPCYPYLDKADQVNERLTSLLHIVGHSDVVTYMGQGHIDTNRTAFDFELINRTLENIRNKTYDAFFRPLAES